MKPPHWPFHPDLAIGPQSSPLHLLFEGLGKNKTFFEGFLGTQSASLNQLKGNSSLYKKTETCWVYNLKVCGPCAFARLAEAKVMRRVCKQNHFQLHSCPRQSMLPKETNISGSNIREYWHYLWRSRYLVPFCLA